MLYDELSKNLVICLKETLASLLLCSVIVAMYYKNFSVIVAMYYKNFSVIVVMYYKNSP